MISLVNLFEFSDLTCIMLLGGDKMAIDKNTKTRIVITVPIELKKQLEIQAKKENRTVANLINTIAIKYIESAK